MNVFILFPHQLHADVSALRVAQKVILVEEFLFFRQYKFHKQKLTFHRASMKFYAQYLQNQGFEVIYVDSSQPESDVRNLIATMSSSGVGNAHFRITN